MAPHVIDAGVDVAPGILDVALGNIIDNAVKFSSVGGTVELNTAVTAGDVFVTVADTGPGIAADELPHVFERFFRGKSARAMGTSGVGLGLAIAQTLVQRQGGTVEIDASASSQFVSGLLLSGATFARGLTVVHTGESVPSAPHVAMTVSMLRDAGVDVDDSEGNRWRVAPGPIAARHWAI